MNPLLLLALVLLMAGMVLRLVGYVIFSLLRGVWRGSRALTLVTARPVLRVARRMRARPLLAQPLATGAAR